MRESISASQKLSLNLRYLATGNTFEDLKFIFIDSASIKIKYSFIFLIYFFNQVSFNTASTRSILLTVSNVQYRVWAAQDMYYCIDRLFNNASTTCFLILSLEYILQLY
jgi:hypothetical protein